MNKPIARISAEEVKAIRERLKLTQRELADKMQANVRTVRHWETRGVTRRSALALRQLLLAHYMEHGQ